MREQAEYVYNALGQQVGRTVGSGPSAVVTLSVHDLTGNRITEHDDTGAVIREYIWLDGRPLAVIEGGQTYQFHWDQIGRPVMATDSTGAVVWAASYLPFGGIDLVWVDTGVLTQNLRFPGQWFQAETGLHQNWMRDYGPTTGRYLQADPLGLVDGPSVYGYAKQSPVRYTDPRGLTGEIPFGASPPSKIPHTGEWKWSPDPNNSRGGTFTDSSGKSASWDKPGGHWDVDDGKGNRQRYDREGNPLTKEEAHRKPRGLKRLPFPRFCPPLFLYLPFAQMPPDFPFDRGGEID